MAAERGLHQLEVRAVQTAAPVARALGLPLIGHAEVYECGGPYEDLAGDGRRTAHPGSPWSVIEAVAAAAGMRIELPDPIGEQGWHTGPYESPGDISARAARVVSGLRSRHCDDAVIAVVSHGCLINQLLRALLGIVTMTGWFAIHNAGVTGVFDEEWELSSVTAGPIDWTPHLRPDEVTDWGRGRAHGQGHRIRADRVSTVPGTLLDLR